MKIPTKEKKHSLTVEVKEPLLDQIKKEARLREITLRQIVEAGFEQFLNDLKKTKVN